MFPLDPQASPDTTQQFPIDSGDTVSTVHPQDVIQSRVDKAHFALGSITGQSKEDINNSFVNGNEQQFREQASSLVDYQKYLAKQHYITDAASQGSISQDALYKLNSLDKPTDPGSVVEQYYGGQFMRTAMDPGDPWTSKTAMIPYMNQQPEQHEDTVNRVTSDIQHRTYAMHWLEEAKTAYANEGWLKYGSNQAKDLMTLGLTSDIALRGHFGIHDLGLGSDIDEQGNQYYDTPLSQAKSTLDDTMKYLLQTDPAKAIRFAQGMVGMSANDIRLENEYTVAQLAAPFIGKLALKPPSGTFRMYTEPGEGPLTGISPQGPKPTGPQFSIGKAASDAIETEQNVDNNGILPHDTPENNPKVVAATAQGDMQSAAVAKSTAQFMDDTTGKTSPELKLTRSLPTGLQTIAQKIFEDDGGAGTEGVNRINQSLIALDTDLGKLTTNLMRVNRMGIMQASDVVNQMAIEADQRRFTGSGSMLTDMAKPAWEPISNTYHRKWTLMRHDATEFRTVEEAEGMAKSYGLAINTPETTIRHQLENRITEANFKLAEQQLKIKLAEGNPITSVWKKRLEHDTAANEALKDRLGEVIGWKTDAPIPAITGGADLVQFGQGWRLEFWQPEHETSSIYRDHMIDLWPNAYSGKVGIKGRKRHGTITPDLPMLKDNSSFWARAKTLHIMGKGEGGSVNAFLPADETLSPEENAQRKIVTFGPGKLMELVQPLNDAYRLAAKQDDAFLRLLNFSQKALDDEGREGKWFTNPGQIDTWYRTYIGRSPKPSVYDGYWSAIAATRVDWTLRSMALGTHAWREGMMEHTIGRTDTSTNETKYSKPFLARQMNTIPADNHTMLIITKDHDTITSAATLGTKNRDKYNDLMTKGQIRVLQLYAPEKNELNDFHPHLNANNKVRYVITDNSTRRNFDMENLLPQRDGIHHMYQYNYKVVRPDITFDNITGTYRFNGHKVFAMTNIQKMGSDLADHLTRLEEMLAIQGEGAVAQMGNYSMNPGVYNSNFGINVAEDFLPHYRTKVDAEGKTHEPYLQYLRTPTKRKNQIGNYIKEPFQVLPMDAPQRPTNEMRLRYEQYGDFEDGLSSGSIAQSHQIEFSAERDAHEIMALHNEGSALNPLWQYRAADLLDPIESLNRSLTRIINSGPYMDDYKFGAGDLWLKTYMPYFEDVVKNRGGEDMIWSRPMYYFNHDDPFASDTPPEIRSLALSNRKKIKDLLGTPSVIQAQMDGLSEMAYNSLYKAGAKEAWVPVHQIQTIRDPVAQMKLLTTNAILGIYNPASFFMQASSFVNVSMLSPKHGPMGTAASTLWWYQRFMGHTPEAIEHMDKLASMAGWKPAWYKEFSNMLLYETNFSHVGSEHVWIPYRVDYPAKVYEHILSKGMVPFTEGAQFTRVTAFATSFLEWRSEHPADPMTRADKANILTKASLYDHDMNKSSNIIISRGPASLLNQFQAYAERLNAIMLGKRISPQQKAGLALGTALLWGIPSTVGLGTYFALEKYIRKQFLQGYTDMGHFQIPGLVGGYQPNQNPYWDLFMNGWVSFMIEEITGKGDYSKGTAFNTFKYGTPGVEVFNNLLDNAAGLYGAILGVPGSIIADTWKGSTQLRAAVYNLSTGGEWKDTPITLDAIADCFKSISTFSHFWQAYIAIKTGRELSRSDQPIAEHVNAGEAIFRAVLGLQRVEESDANIMFQAAKGREDFIKDITRLYAHEYSLAAQNIRMMKSPDDSYAKTADEHMHMANWWISRAYPEFINPKDRVSIQNQVANYKENIVESAQWVLYGQHTPPMMQQQYNEQLNKIHQQGQQ